MIQAQKQYKLLWLNINKLAKQITVKVERNLLTENDETARLDDLDIFINDKNYIEFYNTPIAVFPAESTLGEVLEYIVQSRIAQSDSGFEIDTDLLKKFKSKGEK